MTEQEYIDATDLQKVRMIKDILLDITVDNSNDINVDEMGTVFNIVRTWEHKLTASVEVKN